AVEVAVEVDLVADDADPAVLRVALAGVDPGVRYVGPHLALEEGADAGRDPVRVGGIVTVGERYPLGVAQFGIGLGLAVLVATDRGGLVALGEGRQDRLLDGRGQLEAGLAGRHAEYAYELLPV